LNHIRVLTTQLYTSIKLQQKVYREWDYYEHENYYYYYY
jgi:hypothetical protein